MQMKQDVPDGYKLTEVGVIPEDWGVGQLDEFWSVTDCKHVTAKFIPNGFPLASIKEVQSRFVDLSKAKHTTYDYYKLLTEGRRVLAPGDLILSRNATVGEVAQVMSWHPVFAMGQDVCLLRSRAKEYSSSFLQELFAFSFIKQQLDDCMVGTTFKRVNVKQVKALKVQMPKPEEQAVIAGALSDISTLTTSLEKLIAKKRAIKTATMQQLLTGKKRLPPFDKSHTGYKQTELGEIPEDWESLSLSDLCYLKSGETITAASLDDGAEYPCYGGNGLRGYTANSTHTGEYVLIGRQGALCGNIQYVEGSFFASEHALVATPSTLANATWLAIYLERMNLNQYSESTAQPGLSAEKLLVLKLASPTKDEQLAIANVLSGMDKDINAVRVQLIKTQQLKQGMMQELLTGKTRLVEGT